LGWWIFDRQNSQSAVVEMDYWMRMGRACHQLRAIG
jgi:hypothetical protein